MVLPYECLGINLLSFPNQRIVLSHIIAIYNFCIRFLDLLIICRVIFNIFRQRNTIFICVSTVCGIVIHCYILEVFLSVRVHIFWLLVWPLETCVWYGGASFSVMHFGIISVFCLRVKRAQLNIIWLQVYLDVIRILIVQIILYFLSSRCLSGQNFVFLRIVVLIHRA